MKILMRKKKRLIEESNSISDTEYMLIEPLSIAKDTFYDMYTEEDLYKNRRDIISLIEDINKITCEVKNNYIKWKEDNIQLEIKLGEEIYKLKRSIEYFQKF